MLSRSWDGLDVGKVGFVAMQVVLALHRVLVTNDYQEGDSTGRDRGYQKGGLSLVFVLL